MPDWNDIIVKGEAKMAERLDRLAEAVERARSDMRAGRRPNTNEVIMLARMSHDANTALNVPYHEQAMARSAALLADIRARP